ncbi:MAG: hypothetical protein NVSMB19_01570 [Vulcanimicrobiaceae bacterium]
MNVLRSSGTRASALAALAVATAFPLAAATPASAADASPSGATITGKMMTELDTGKVEAGKGFSMQVTRPYPNGDPSYAGAVVRGHVADVQHASQGKKASIALTFDSIVLPNGQSSKLTGHVLTVDKKQQSAVLQQAAGAGAGMVVGNIVGKALGTNAGGLLGAAGGFAYGNNRKTNYVIPENAEVTLQTDTTVARPQARQ